MTCKRTACEAYDPLAMEGKATVLMLLWLAHWRTFSTAILSWSTPLIGSHCGLCTWIRCLHSVKLPDPDTDTERISTQEPHKHITILLYNICTASTSTHTKQLLPSLTRKLVSLATRCTSLCSASPPCWRNAWPTMPQKPYPSHTTFHYMTLLLVTHHL